MRKLLEQLQKKFANIVFFASLFLIVGAVLPDFYYKYLDKRDYFRVESATVVGGILKPCGNVRIRLDSVADFNIQGDAIVEVVLYSENHPEVEAQKFERRVAIEKGSVPVIQVLPLECTLEEGEYFARGSIRYYVHGGEHITTWRTNLFPLAMK